jgi:predicted methyltransferase
MDPDQWLKTIYDSMKPGAVVVVDHVANPGDTRDTVRNCIASTRTPSSRLQEGGLRA